MLSVQFFKIGIQWPIPFYIFLYIYKNINSVACLLWKTDIFSQRAYFATRDKKSLKNLKLTEKLWEFLFKERGTHNKWKYLNSLKYCENFSALRVALMTMTRRSGRRATKSFTTTIRKSQRRSRSCTSSMMMWDTDFNFL